MDRNASAGLSILQPRSTPQQWTALGRSRSRPPALLPCFPALGNAWINPDRACFLSWLAGQNQGPGTSEAPRIMSAWCRDKMGTLALHATVPLDTLVPTTFIVIA